MTENWTRRHAIRALATGAALPALASGATPPRVAVIGGGMAGVAAAWLLDGTHDVVLLEAAASLGGNVQTLPIQVGGNSYLVDMGAQYFHPGAYPTYVKLLTYLGLFPTQTGGSHSFPASITVDATSEATPRFLSPILPGRIWPVLASWNSAGLEAFTKGFLAAQRREDAGASWGVSLEQWLPTLGLTQAQWEGMLLPWAASLYSGSIDEARTYSARAAMVFAAKALPDQISQQLLYYVLNQGMIEPLKRMVTQFTTVQVLTGAAVTSVSPNGAAGFLIRCADGRQVTVDELVFACSGGSTLALLRGIPGSASHRAALSGIEFRAAHLALHTDPAYVSSNPAFGSFFNCRIEGSFAEASMNLAPVLAPSPSSAGPGLWKSWITHRATPPAQILHEARYRHMLPSTSTIAAQAVLNTLQGKNGIWIAGGYTLPFDSQETALLSAASIAGRLGAAPARLGAIGIF